MIAQFGRDFPDSRSAPDIPSSGTRAGHQLSNHSVQKPVHRKQAQSGLKKASNFAFRAVAGLLALSVTFAASPAALAQDKLLSSGDAVTTGFSGIAPTGDAPEPGGTPLDTFFIDLNGPSAQIFSMNSMSGSPQGQLETPAPKKIFKASELGQVFAITMDRGYGSDIPNIYFGATSAYGVHIAQPDPAKPGKFVRLRRGNAEAQWMRGMFADGIGGGPGSILKADGQSGTVSVFATLPENSGPGVGDVVFDTASKTIYASDLDNGLIYRIDSTGNVVGSFDHGVSGRPTRGLPAVSDDGSVMTITDGAFDVENPATWGYTQKDRMVYGMAVHNSRLYYAVAGGQQIWSVGLSGNGAFAGDPRWELDVKLLTSDGPITDIVFDKSGRMYLAQRGSAKGSYDYSVFASSGQSTVVRYRREQPDDPSTPSVWVDDAERYAVGTPEPHQNSNGGIALGFTYGEDGRPIPGTGDKMLWTTGEKLRTSSEDAVDVEPEMDVHGLQGNATSLVRPDNEPPLKSYFIDYDGFFNDPEKAGHMGDVEIYHGVGDVAQFPPAGDGGYYLPPYDQPPGDYLPPEIPNPGYDLNLRLTKRATPKVCQDAGAFWRCRYRIRVRNTSLDNWFAGPIHVQDTLLAMPAGTTISVPGHPFPWQCWWVAAPDTFKCRRNVVLAPGASVALAVVARVPKGLKRCRLSNAGEITWPRGGSWNNTNPADDVDVATAIIPDPFCKPDGQRSNLRLKKVADPAMCAKAPSGKVVCRYRVTVRNTGPGVFKGPIHVRDTPPAGVNLGFVPVPPGAGFQCAPSGAGALCKHNGAPVTLGVGDTVGFPIYLLTTPEVARGLGCRIRNKARITTPVGGSIKNFIAGDDADSAVATVPADICNEPETNLRVQKRVDGRCTPSGGNWKCRWNIVVRNTTANTYKGPLTLKETLPGATVSANWNAPWNCVGGGAVATCSRGYTEIPAFGQTWLKLETVFSEAVVKANKCKLLNKVEIIEAAGGSPMNTNPADDVSQSTGVVPANVCFTPVPVLCPPGFKPDATGKSCIRKSVRPIDPGLPLVPPRFECPAGFNKVRGSRVARLRRQGWSLTRLGNGRWCGRPGRVVPDPKFCPPGTVGKYPRCRTIVKPCPTGTVRQNGQCVPIIINRCPPGTVGKYPRCRPIVRPCPRGMVRRKGICVPIIIRKCPPGTVGKYPRCRPIVTPCPRGMVRRKGICVPIIIRKCPPGTVGKYPRCRTIIKPCPRGMVRRKGICVPIIIRKCPPGTVGKYPRCRTIIKPTCPRGTVGKFPRCRPVIKPSCPRGTVGKFPRCRPVVKPRCPRGTVGKFPRCRPVVKPRCPRGTVGKFPRCRPVIKPRCPRGTVGKFPRCRSIGHSRPSNNVRNFKVRPRLQNNRLRIRPRRPNSQLR